MPSEKAARPSRRHAEISAAILWLYGRFDGVGAGPIAGQTVALGVASTLGASAGRLLLQGGNDGAQ